MTYLLLTHLQLLRPVLVRLMPLRLDARRLISTLLDAIRFIPKRLVALRPVPIRLTHRPRIILVGLFLALSAHPTVAHACAVCVGDPNDPQTRGASSAVLLLMGITGCVLSCFVAFFCHLWWRGRRPLDSAMTYGGPSQDKLREEELQS